MSSTLVLPAASKQPVDWKTIENELYDWVTETLGLDAIWEEQNAPQPNYPYASMMRGPESDEGGQDEIRQRTLDADDKIVGVDPTAGDPVENEQIAYQPVVFTLTTQVHVDFENGSTDASCDAKQKLSKLKRSLGLTSTIARLRAVGVSIVEKLDVLPIGLVVNGEWLSRATFDVRLRTASVMSERQGFIDKVQLVSTDFDVDVTVDAS